MGKTSRKTIFNPDWVHPAVNLQWAETFAAVPEDVFKVYCKICKKCFELSNMGRQALISHEKGKIHAKNLKLKNSNVRIETIISLGAEQQTGGNVNFEKCDKLDKNQNANVLDKFLLGTEIIDAEILWCLTVCHKNLSYNSCATIIPMFKKMFPDSAIAKKMSLGYTKAAYMTSYGCAPYFKSSLEDLLAKTDNYTICFDEAFNKIVQRGQMDIHVRFFNDDTHEVETRFFNSVFMNYTTAEDILAYFLKGVEPLQTNKILQVWL